MTMRTEKKAPHWPGSTQFLAMPCTNDLPEEKLLPDVQPDSVLYTHFGTSTPCWRLFDDSNALHLSPVQGESTFTVALDKIQAGLLRAFTGVTSHAVIDVQFFNCRQKLNLVGRKVDQHTWSGTAANYTDTPSVASTLAQGLAFAEQVVSEV